MKCLAALLLGLMSQWTFADIVVAVPRDVILDYQKLLRNRDVMEIRDYSGVGSRRDTVEVILFQQALLRAGVDEPVHLTPIDSYSRILVEVESGNVSASATSAWASDISQTKALMSVPLIREGEYVVGVYIAEGNSKSKDITGKELRNFTAVTNRAWKNDIATLESLGVTRIESAPTFGMIARMLKGERGEFTLSSFKSSADMDFVVEGVRLLPVKGIKVAMPGSRHFLVAPTPQGNQILDALNKGLNKMRKDGSLRRAYTEAGFFNARVESWQLLNPTAFGATDR